MSRAAYPLMFEKSRPGRRAYDLPSLDVPAKDGLLDDSLLAEKADRKSTRLNSAWITAFTPWVPAL